MTVAQRAREFANLRSLQRLLRMYEIVYGDIHGIARLRAHVADEMRKVAKLIGYGL